MSYIKIIGFFLLCTLAICASALTQNEKLWLGAGTVRDLSNDGTWRYLLMTQARFIDESRPVQSLLAEAGIGKVIITPQLYGSVIDIQGVILTMGITLKIDYLSRLCQNCLFLTKTNLIIVQDLKSYLSEMHLVFQ